MKQIRQWEWTVLVCAACCLLAASANADTYNFFFSKPKKKGASAAPAPAPAPVNDDEEEETPPPAPAPQPAQQRVAVTPAGGQPVVINNNNNITFPTAPVYHAPAPKVEAPAAPAGESTVATKVVGPSDYSYPFHLSLGAAYYTGRKEYHYDDSSYYGGYTSVGNQWAGVVNLGVDFTRTFGINAYASQVVKGYMDGDKFDFGGDIEFTPFRITGRDADYLRLGFLAGTSKAFITHDPGMPFDVGARVTLNLDRTFGITAAVRTNVQTAMADLGIITHF